MTRPEAPTPGMRPEAPAPGMRPEAPAPMMRPEAPAPMMRPEAPAPMMRRGPRPLLMHLMLTARSQPCESKSPTSGSDSNGSKQPRPESSARPGRPDHPAVEGLPAGLDVEFIAGVAAYRRHPYRRCLPDPASLWQQGETRLLDFGPGNGVPGGIPVIFVPSLINRGTILDLSERGSMLRFLSDQGIRPMLLEWGWPGPTERGFSLSDYITQRLECAIIHAASQCGGRVILAGYCMGGLLCVAAAQRRPREVAALALIATPWDFHAAGSENAERLSGLAHQFESEIARTGTLPIDAIQYAFAGIDPASVGRKFRDFAVTDQDSERARLFVAIEDWVNDAVPLAGPVAIECLEGWYGNNTPARGAWHVGGSVIRPETLALPSLFAIPQRDRIVPPQSATPLADAMAGSAIPPTVMNVAGGHVGLVAGARARELLWEPLRDWLLGVDMTAREQGRPGK